MAEDKWDQITGYCCGSCRYYSPKDQTIGRCRRNAPTMAGFPVVYPTDDWCGEHKIGTNPHTFESRAARDTRSELEKHYGEIEELKAFLAK